MIKRHPFRPFFILLSVMVFALSSYFFGIDMPWVVEEIVEEIFVVSLWVLPVLLIIGVIYSLGNKRSGDVPAQKNMGNSEVLAKLIKLLEIKGIITAEELSGIGVSQSPMIPLEKRVAPVVPETESARENRSVALFTSWIKENWIMKLGGLIFLIGIGWLVADLGDDEFGRQDIETLKGNGVDTSFVRVHKDKKSNYHFVLWYRAERTILIKHEEYEYALPDMGNPKWIYFSSVGENSIPYHHAIADYLNKNPRVKLAFQPGTFQIKLGYEKLKDLYARTEVFFCNKEEAQIILGNKEESDIPTLARKMSGLGPKISVITDGPRGAFAFDGTDVWFMPPYPDPAPPLERTGAGDSFSSTFTVALALGKSVDEALSWGPINSMSVVQHVGAQEGLLTREKLEEYLANRPQDYQPRKV